MKLTSRTTIFLLLLILLLGAGLRFYRLGAEDLWLDEILTIKYSSIPWSGLRLGQLDSDAITHFLADYIIMHLWVKLGTTAAIVRLFSALVGIASIAVMFFVGRRLFSAPIGLLSALFLAISSYHIYYSQEARAYALQVLLILSMVYLFYRGLEENKMKFWVIFSLISILAIYLQAFSIFSLIAIDLYFILRLWFGRRTVRVVPWFISQGMIFLGCLPYLIYLIRPSVHAERLSWLPKPTVQDIVNTFALFSGGRMFWLIPEYLRNWFIPLFLFSIILSLISFTNSTQKKVISFDRHQGTILTWSLFTIPIILFYVISFKSPIFLADRYLIITLPFFYLLVAYGISKLEYRTIKSITTAILLCGMLIGLHAHNSVNTKIRWSQVAQVIADNSQKDDLILIAPYYWNIPLNYYMKSPIPVQAMPEQSELDTKMPDLVKSHSRVWFITVTGGINTVPAEFATTIKKYYQHQQIILTLTQPSQVDVILYFNPIPLPK